MLSLCVYYDLYGVNANWEYRRHYVDKLVPDSPPPPSTLLWHKLSYLLFLVSKRIAANYFVNNDFHYFYRLCSRRML